VSPVALNVVAPLVVPTWANELQLAPLQRSIRYPVTPTLSVEAVQLSPICVLEDAVAVTPPGAVGTWVSAVLVVVTKETLEYALKFPAASVALTR
jgi:hypothetical protein